MRRLLAKLPQARTQQSGFLASAEHLCRTNLHSLQAHLGLVSLSRPIVRQMYCRNLGGPLRKAVSSRLYLSDLVCSSNKYKSCVTATGRPQGCSKFQSF